ncbi:MAG: Uma2 family endonuclease [Anaerolineae bacterium]|nr:Uma2 family endonuclease [Candidatus Roseilinea sp.]MDW8449374.1 Uma2 family endonuclease [Anaerolineae bacterium]
MAPAVEATPAPPVVTGADGLPRISQEYLEEYERFVQTIVTEDDTPVDNIFSAKQARLLVESLYASWQHPEFGRRFIADGNVGVFYALRRPPVVPDMFLSLDVTLPADIWKKTNRSYFIWEYGKPPEVVVEVVSNEEGDEERADGKLRIYAQMGIVRYVVYDPALHTGSEPLRLYTLMQGRLRRTDETWFDEVQLGVTLWRGVYEEREDTWLRWCDRNGVVVPTGAERAEAERQRAEAERQRAEAEHQRAEAERERAERLAARLRAAGIDPDA